MKLNQFKVGQTVKDIYGNIYTVLGVDYDQNDNIPVKLKCTKRSGKYMYVTWSNNSRYNFEYEGSESWINKDELKDFTIFNG